MNTTQRKINKLKIISKYINEYNYDECLELVELITKYNYNKKDKNNKKEDERS